MANVQLPKEQSTAIFTHWKSQKANKVRPPLPLPFSRPWLDISLLVLQPRHEESLI